MFTHGPPPLCFCPLLKISLGNSYLKILDLTKLFVADALMKLIKRLSVTPSQSTLKYGSENNPWLRGLRVGIERGCVGGGGG